MKVEKVNGVWVLFNGVGYAASASNMSFNEALDCFAANFPHVAEELDALRDDDLMGAQKRQNGHRERSARPTKRGSGSRFRELIMAGKTNQEALDVVRAEFPESKATLSDAAWNRNELRRNGGKYNVDGTKKAAREARLAEDDLADVL